MSLINETTTLLPHLANLRDDVNDFILDLALDLTSIETKFANKLRQVCAAHAREINRRLTGDPGTPDYFERFEVFRLMAMLLTHRHLGERVYLLKSGTLNRADDRRITRFLIASMGDFASGRDDLAGRFTCPSVIPQLARRIWLNFYDVTAEECQRDADDIKGLVILTDEQKARLRREVDEIKAAKGHKENEDRL